MSSFETVCFEIDVVAVLRLMMRKLATFERKGVMSMGQGERISCVWEGGAKKVGG